MKIIEEYDLIQGEEKYIGFPNRLAGEQKKNIGGILIRLYSTLNRYV